MPPTESPTTPHFMPTPLRQWAFMRQAAYLTGIVTFLVLFGIWGYQTFLYTAPTCSDGAMNGEEGGVDCDGSCEKICTARVVEPKIEWAQAFKVQDGVYHAIAVISNSNPIAGTKSLSYILTLEDAQGVITERAGTTTLPPDGQYPIFEARIATGSRVPRSVRVTFDKADSYWSALTAKRHDYTVLSRTISGAGSTAPRLNATIQSNLYTSGSNLRVVAVAYDSKRTPLVASQTVIPSIAAQGKSDVVFTWTSPIAGTLRSCQVPSDIALMLDRSGSMAADGGTPPEPFESAKTAAASFISSLNDSDRAAVISYATTPSIDAPLMSTHADTEAALMTLTLHKDGVQYTDLSAAIREAFGILRSSAHNPDARQVIALMTDGDITRPLNPETNTRDIEYAEAQAFAAAEEVKRAGIILYTIGFGKEFADDASGVLRNRELIAELATSPAHSFLAPTKEDLARVYQEISAGVCEDGPSIIDIFVIPQ